MCGYCSNTNYDAVSLFLFPKDPAVRARWSAFVRLTRKDWLEPTATSVLCSAHFEPSCFDEQPNLMGSLGFNVRYRRVLKPGSVPTLTNRSVTPARDSGATNEPSSPKRPRSAFVKRERKRVGLKVTI